MIKRQAFKKKRKGNKTIRSLLFDLSFYLMSFVLLSLALPLTLLPQSVSFKVARLWSTLTMGLLQYIVGLTYRVEGLENLPSGPFIIACKHESAWETIIFHILLKKPIYALKRELMWIPIINIYFWRMQMVVIDRKAGTKALKVLLKGARQAAEKAHPLVIFPEGTRGTPGQPTTYQSGVSILYRDLGIPVVPVALNSGMFWGRRSFAKQPGEITIQFLPSIAPGLSRADFMRDLTNSIENACHGLQKREDTQKHV